MSDYTMGSAPFWARLINRIGGVEKLNTKGYRYDETDTWPENQGIAHQHLDDVWPSYRVKEFLSRS